LLIIGSFLLKSFAVKAVISIDYDLATDYVKVTVGYTIPPVCDSLSRTPANGLPPLQVTFTGSGHDTDGTITQYEFDFGDGSPKITTTSDTVKHTYTTTGTFCAKLRVQDNDGNWSGDPGNCPANCAKEVDVSEGGGAPENTPPTAAFSCDGSLCQGAACNGVWGTYNKDCIFNLINQSTDFYSVHNIYLKYPLTDNSQYGLAVSATGDLNNDGYKDIIVGAPYADADYTDSGAVYVFYGSNSMPSTSSPDLYLKYPKNDAGSEFGYIVFSGGDINNDGYDDVVVGAPKSDAKCTDCGAAYIFYGGNPMDGDYDVYLEYSRTDSDSLIGNFGKSVYFGDFNNDNFDDVIVTAFTDDTKCTDCGAAYIYFGSAFLSATATSDVYLQYPWNDSTARLGEAAAAGDVNNDGYDDAIVGASLSDYECSDGGAVFVYYGSSSMDGNYDVYLRYPGSDIAHLGFSVAAGDVNNDGYDDVISGANWSDVKCTYCGAVYVYYGGSSMDSDYDVYLEYPRNEPGSLLNLIDFGSAVFAEDINKDNYDDVVVGAPYSDAKCSDCGAVYIYFGSSSMDKDYDIYIEYPGSDSSALFGFRNVSVGCVRYQDENECYPDVVAGSYNSDIECPNCGVAYSYERSYLDPDDNNDIVTSTWSIFYQGGTPYQEDYTVCTDNMLTSGQNEAICDITLPANMPASQWYYAELEVEDTAGSTDATTHDFYVSQDIIADFECSLKPDSGWQSCDGFKVSEGARVYFKDTSTGSENTSGGYWPITSWSWTFTDGTPSTSNAQNPSATFEALSSNSGLVTLSVVDQNGRSDQVSYKLYVTVPLPQWREISP